MNDGDAALERADIFVDLRSARTGDAAAVVADPRVQAARSLRLAQWRSGGDELDYRPFVAALAANPPPELAVLRIDGFASFAAQSRAPIGPVGPLLARSPALRRCAIVGTCDDARGASSATLEALELAAATVSDEVLLGLAAGKFPRLAALRLTVGEGPARGTLASLLALITGLAATAPLRELHLAGLRAGEAAQVLHTLATTGLLPRLRALSLLHGEPDPDLRAPLDSAAPQLRHLTLTLPRRFWAESPPTLAITLATSWPHLPPLLPEGDVELPERARR